MNWEAVKAALTTILRHVLSVASGGLVVWLSEHGFDVGSEVALLVGVIAGVVVNVGFAVAVTLLRKWKLDVALNLNASATHADLNAIADAVPKLTQISQAISLPKDDAATMIPVPPATLIVPVALVESKKDDIH